MKKNIILSLATTAIILGGSIDAYAIAPNTPPTPIQIPSKDIVRDPASDVPAPPSQYEKNNSTNQFNNDEDKAISKSKHKKNKKHRTDNSNSYTNY